MSIEQEVQQHPELLEFIKLLLSLDREHRQRIIEATTNLITLTDSKRRSS